MQRRTITTAHVERAGAKLGSLRARECRQNAPLKHRALLRQSLNSIADKESPVTMYQCREHFVVKTCEIDGVVDFIKVIKSSPTEEADNEKRLPSIAIEDVDGSELISVQGSSDNSSDTLVASASRTPNE